LTDADLEAPARIGERALVRRRDALPDERDASVRERCAGIRGDDHAGDPALG
jgi:hypothetical protein